MSGRCVLTHIKCYRRLEPSGLRCLTIQVTQDSKEFLQFDLNVFLQREGVQARVFGPQPGLRRLGDVRAGEQALIRCLRRWLMDAFGLPGLLRPLPELEGRLEVANWLHSWAYRSFINGPSSGCPKRSWPKSCRPWVQFFCSQCALSFLDRKSVV